MNARATSQSSRQDHISEGVPYVRLKLLLIGLLAWCSSLTFAQDGSTILIIKSNEAVVYDSVIDQIEQRLLAGCIPRQQTCLSLELYRLIADDSATAPPPHDLVISLGQKAREYAQRQYADSRIINAMIPTEQDRLEDARNSSLKHPTLVLDQPPLRDLLLIKYLLPEARRIGLLISRENAQLIDPLEHDAERLDLKLVVSIVDEEAHLGRQLAVMLDQIDVLLALPDIKIHNRQNVSSILLTTYRNRIPLIGFSSAYVKAGALAAIYSTPENIGDHLADLIDQLYTSTVIPTQVIYPKYFSVSINSRVAHSLAIQLPLDSDKLEQLIRDAEQ